MNKQQLQTIMDYLDNEYAGIVNRLTSQEKKARYQHWAKEIGTLDFNAAMNAVRKLARGQYIPRTAEVISEVEKLQESIRETEQASGSKSSTCRIYRNASGDEIYETSNNYRSNSGELNALPEWLQIKLRWMANPTEENIKAWDNWIMTFEAKA